MSPPRHPLFLLLRAVLAAGLLAVTAAGAAEGGFTATLSSAQQSAAGLTALSPAERASLDQLVSREIALVRQEKSAEPDGAFIARCTGPEREHAGLDRLTATQQTRLNELVAAALFTRPVPRQRPRIKDNEVLNPAMKPEIHGSISLTYGRGSGGGSFHGAAFNVDYFDPASGLGLSVGIANYSGHGLYGFYPAGFGYPYDYGYDGLGLMGGPYRFSPYDDPYYGDGETLRTGWDQAGRYRRRP